MSGDFGLLRGRTRGEAFHQTGVTLIELMIALALGVVLVLGIMQVFSGVRSAFATSEGLSRVQENARFAMQFIRFDTRMAGNFGCRNEFQLIYEPAKDGQGYYNHTVTDTAPATARRLTGVATTGLDTAPYTLQLHRPVQVYDYVGTSPGDTFAPNLAIFPGGVGAATAFVPNLPAALIGNSLGLDASGLLGGEVGDLVPGSDVLVLRYLSETTIAVPGGLVDTTGVLSGASATDFPLWRIFAIAHCSTVSIFQITSNAPASLASGATNLNRQAWGYIPYGNGVPAHSVEFAVYYIGRTGDDTPPALFRRRLRQDPGSAAQGAQIGPAEELIPGVEMMQVLVGVDTEPQVVVVPPAVPPAADQVVNAFRSASQHIPGGTNIATQYIRERSIVSLRVSLMIRSPESIGADPQLATRIVGDVVVTPPRDQRLRQVYDTTTAIRNRQRN
ncbi:MAG: PilW family protein [Pseudomarimonas sp.]